MVAVKASDVDRAVQSRAKTIGVLLFFGPDAGRVTERARHAAESATDDPADPFALVRLDGDRLADEPARLIEEATTFGMFGGRRAIWVRPTSRNLVPAVSPLLDIQLDDMLVVIEAGDLAKTAPLRALCERSPRALALPSFADEPGDVAAVISSTLAEHGLTIEAAARDLLRDSLGGDRLTTRSELNKLALYAHGQSEVTLADVEASVSDVSALALDATIDMAFLGRIADLDEGLAQLATHGTSPAQILALSLRHALGLLAAAEPLGRGETLDGALRSWRGLHFRRKDAVGRQLRLWTESALVKAIAGLQSAVLETRRMPALAEALTSRSLIALADQARKARR